LLKSTVFKN